MWTFILFIYIFVVFISIYILFHLKKIKINDIVILAIASLSLLMFAPRIPLNNHIESFTPPVDISTAIQKYKPIDLEENIEKINKNLTIYLTTFNKQSFNNMGRSWFNISPRKTDINSIFSFESAPLFSRTTGLYLGNNRIVGPLSSELGIQYNNTYTIVLCCKHGNLVVDEKTGDIEIFKLYANSPNNNGLTLFIKKGSVRNENNTLTGSLLFQYANFDPVICKIDNNHDLINFDKDVLTFYFIVRDIDNIRILTMNEKSNKIHQILRMPVKNMDVNFSNKEIIINRLSNWNGNILSFALYNSALTDEHVSNFYVHFTEEYLKNIDPNFTRMLGQYNDTINLLHTMSKCPFDESTCKQCEVVQNWTDISAVANAPLSCKSSINTYCSTNPSHNLCKCWDTSSPMFKTDNCKLYRNLFNDQKQNAVEMITTDDISSIKTKFGLIHPNQCPAAITKTPLIKNEYSDYEWNKLKVTLDSEDGEKKIRSKYAEETTSETVSNKTNNNKTPTQTDVTIPPPDSFFSRFMKIVVPSS